MSAKYTVTGRLLYIEPYTTKQQRQGHLVGIRTADGSNIQLYTTQPLPNPGTDITATGNITQQVNHGGYLVTTLRDATISLTPIDTPANHEHAT